MTSTAAVVVGACLGSFAGTATLRATRAEQAVTGRSRCDHCGVQLGFAATLPVISFALRSGACAQCGGRIDPLHPAAELIGAAVTVLAVLSTEPLQAALVAALGLVLLAASVFDFKTQRLPDALTLVAAMLCAALSALSGRLIAGLIAAAVTFLILEALRRGVSRAKGRQALGFGDVKLLAALALWLGFATPWAVAVAAVAGLLMIVVLRPADGRIPFGPAIALAAWTIGLLLEAGLLSFPEVGVP